MAERPKAAMASLLEKKRMKFFRPTNLALSSFVMNLTFIKDSTKAETNGIPVKIVNAIRYGVTNR